MRNSLPLRRSVGGGSEENGGGLVLMESHWEVDVTLQHSHRRRRTVGVGGEGGVMEKGKPCSLHKDDILQRLWQFAAAVFDWRFNEHAIKCELLIYEYI